MHNHHNHHCFGDAVFGVNDCCGRSFYLAENVYTKEQVDRVNHQQNLHIRQLEEAVAKLELLNQDEIEKMISDYSYAKETIDKMLETKADKSLVEAIQEELKSKQDALVSGVNIKTINGESILGEGNIVIEGGSGTPTDTYTKEEIDQKVNDAKQELSGKIDDVKSDIPTPQTGEYGSSKNYIWAEHSVSGRQVLSDIMFDSDGFYVKYGTQRWGEEGGNYSMTQLPQATRTHAGTLSSYDYGEFKDAVDTSKSNSNKINLMQADLDKKQEKLVAGTNIKTINGETILGEGNIVITGGETIDAYTKEEADNKFGTKTEQESLRSDVEDALGEIATLEADKQDKLEKDYVSSIEVISTFAADSNSKLTIEKVNPSDKSTSTQEIAFKTVNGESVIGEGDITITSKDYDNAISDLQSKDNELDGKLSTLEEKVAQNVSKEDFEAFKSDYEGKSDGIEEELSDLGDDVDNLKLEIQSKANKSDIPEIDGLFNDVSYNDDTHNIEFKHNGTVLKSLSAEPFIKDGMVSSVEVKDDKLVITFNTDAGKSPIEIDLSEIFKADDYYKKDEIDSKVSEINNTITSTKNELTGLVESKVETINKTIEDINSELDDISNDLDLINLSDYVTTGALETYKGEVEADLDKKQDKLVSGTNVKTVNGESILGEGNIKISVDTIDAYTKQEADEKFADKVEFEDVKGDVNGLQSTVQGIGQTLEAFSDEFATKEELEGLSSNVDGLSDRTTQLSQNLKGKQDELVSGSNIKTINGESILGSGNIEISAGDVPTAQTGIVGTDGNYVYSTGVKVDYDSKYPYKGIPDPSTAHNVVAEISSMAHENAFYIYERLWGDDSMTPAHTITIPAVSSWDAGLMTPAMMNKLNSLEKVDTSSFATKEELSGLDDKYLIKYFGLSEDNTGLDYQQDGSTNTISLSSLEGLENYYDKSEVDSKFANTFDKDQFRTNFISDLRTGDTSNNVEIRYRSFSSPYSYNVKYIDFKTINGENIVGEGNIEISGGETIDAYTKQEADNKFATIERLEGTEETLLDNFGQFSVAISEMLEDKADKSDVPTVQVGNGTDKNYVYGAGVKVDYNSKYPYKGMPDSTTYHNVVAEIAGMATANGFQIYERQWGDDSMFPDHVITIPEVSDYDAGLMTPSMRNKLNSLEKVDTSSFATKEELEGKQDRLVGGFVSTINPSEGKSKITYYINPFANPGEGTGKDISFKTINGETVLGEGNIDISVDTNNFYTKSQADSKFLDTGWSNFAENYFAKTEDLNNKQNRLETYVKTVGLDQYMGTIIVGNYDGLGNSLGNTNVKSAKINNKTIIGGDNFSENFKLVESLDDTPLKMKRISQSDYDSLGSKDENTLYIITD